MNLMTTLILLGLFAGLTAFAGWRGSRPPDILRGPRMAPWRFLMLLGVTACVFLIVHLFNLAGFQTGTPGAEY